MLAHSFPPCQGLLPVSLFVFILIISFLTLKSVCYSINYLICTFLEMSFLWRYMSHTTFNFVLLLRSTCNNSYVECLFVEYKMCMFGICLLSASNCLENLYVFIILVRIYLSLLLHVIYSFDLLFFYFSSFLINQYTLPVIVLCILIASAIIITSLSVVQFKFYLGICIFKFNFKILFVAVPTSG